MADTKAKRRGQDEDSIFFLADRNRYIGDVSVAGCFVHGAEFVQALAWPS